MSTPLMRQYQKVKAKYPDTILLFRMGDFYETFEEDARTTAQVLGITLTKRGNGAAGEVPLAGFPHHALDAYLPKLLKAGHRVAICEQLEDPKKAKGIVKRDVVEVVTPGVSYSDKVLDQRQNNYLAAIALPSAITASNDPVGFSFVDVSTGEFRTSEVVLRSVLEHVANLRPSELLVQKRDLDTIRELLKGRVSVVETKLDDWIFHIDYANELLTNHFNTKSLKGYGIDAMGMGIVAAGAILHYLQETQKANIPHIARIAPHDVSEFMVLDPSTKKNLEIDPSTALSSSASLFTVIDRTVTPMGGRKLRRWLNEPLKAVDTIQRRLTGVAEFHDEESFRRTVRNELQDIGDLERLIARVATERANPREVLHLNTFLSKIPTVKKCLGTVKSKALSSLRDDLQTLDGLTATISAALAEDPPLSLAEGGVIRQGYNSELDEIRSLAMSGKEWIAQLQQTERQRTGISSLKVGYNNVFGYYIEVTNTHKAKVPENYIRKQTLTNAERYITPGLKEYEEKVLHAEEKIVALETRLFNELRKEIGGHAVVIQQNADAVATLDCFASLAEVAAAKRFVRPTIDESSQLRIKAGRHPVIEELLPPGEHYTPNDTMMDVRSDQILVVTGPNMSGKSSYLRQVGLIVLLAQIGSYVPADEAHVGVVDKIFTRVGASDNIALGESTFLVEMHEAAHIANTATEKSLILLDEIGRGTSTFDGISIAWALSEYLHEKIKAKTLFATHYHELNALAQRYPRIKNYKVDVREYGDKVIFLHKVVPGSADHSYGIQVAQMAGLPAEVTDRAKSILKNLEGSELILAGGENSQPSAAQSAEVQMTLFELKDDRLHDELQNLDLNTMTPVDAMKALADLKKRFCEKK